MRDEAHALCELFCAGTDRAAQALELAQSMPDEPVAAAMCAWWSAIVAVRVEQLQPGFNLGSTPITDTEKRLTLQRVRLHRVMEARGFYPGLILLELAL